MFILFVPQHLSNSANLYSLRMNMLGLNGTPEGIELAAPPPREALSGLDESAIDGAAATAAAATALLAVAAAAAAVVAPT